MPGMTGAELVAQARQAQPDLKAIIVSGYAELPEGAPLEVPRLAKPFGDADLAQHDRRCRGLNRASRCQKITGSRNIRLTFRCSIAIWPPSKRMAA